MIASDAGHTEKVVAAPSPGSDLRANRCRPLPACGRRQAAAAGEAIGKAVDCAGKVRNPQPCESQSSHAVRALREARCAFLASPKMRSAHTSREEGIGG